MPALVQVFDIGTRLMIDLKVATPVQDFIDKEKYDISDLEPNVLAYYTVDGKLWSMPFNTSNPMLYYNKDMFKAAGLDPDKPPRTWAEVEDAAKKLTKKDAAGKVDVYGAALRDLRLVLRAVHRGLGRLLCRTTRMAAPGRPPRRSSTAPKGSPSSNWWKKLYDEGVMGNYGRTTVDTRNAFMAGQTAMIIESTATLRGLMDGSTGKFELGTGFLPRPNEEAFEKSGTIIGGASVWILKDRPAGRAAVRLGVHQVHLRRRPSRPTGRPCRATTRSARPATTNRSGQGMARQVSAVPDRHRPAPRRAEQPLHPGRPDRRLPDRPPDHRKRDRRSAGRQGHAAAGVGQGRRHRDQGDPGIQPDDGHKVTQVGARQSHHQ